jgi:glutamate synthase domain-containing protein 2/glutamate synthase domain-containing protein 3
VVGAALDRNGLRPARYAVTSDGLVVLGSEAGMVPLDPRRVVRRGRLGPGQMLIVNTESGKLLANEDVKSGALFRQPYGEWLEANLVRVPRALESAEIPVTRTVGLETREPGRGAEGDLVRRQILFGYTREEISLVLEPMVATAAEAGGSMGDDTAPAPLSGRPRLLYHYLRQKFAQVTNPPIDSIREKLVMSLDVYLGRRRSLLEETAEHARLVHLPGPILSGPDVEALLDLKRDGRPLAASLDATFPADEGPDGLERALARLAPEAEAAIDSGAEILVLSDGPAGEERAPVPMLAAVGAVHHGLIASDKRTRASLVAETGEARDVHQLACLIGYGASAVHPYLAFETLDDLHGKGAFEGLSLGDVRRRFATALETGILKIMSKMGISTLSAYQGAQIFETLGIGAEVADRCFAGTPSRLGGIGFREMGKDLFERHEAAYATQAAGLAEGGFFRFRRDGDAHGFSPAVARALFKATGSGQREDYEAYLTLSRSQPATALRELLRFKRTRPPVDVEDVEPVEAILRRFTTGAMSLGALSPEAHETLAVGMNRMGAKSNTGEGGEDPRRFRPVDPARDANSAIKQVASGRFGVTPAYLAHAQELEIKMAQGSKPGEGGQLPGHKVSRYIAALRHTLPGTPLISPPPHHDIYSIEDLAQLIYDLKQANDRARVSVKLVAEEGVGTIAAGVAKGYADVIHISGHEGGTGASPLSSIKHAGMPWELGLAETQQVLVLNDLRDRVRLRADGGLKSGRDVLVAALLGAEEYAFGTAALIAMGCRMARQCHLNTCPVGIATQREDLRAKFPGTPDHVWNLFVHVAFEVRELLAGMGFRGLDEVIGRMDLLEPDDRAREGRAAALDLTALLWVPDDGRPLHSSLGRNLPPAESFDDRLLGDVRAALDSGVLVGFVRRVRNGDRAVGTRISGEIALRYGTAGLPAGTVELELEGSAGQSLGAFLAPGVRILLDGEANDYVGKGMSGGEIVIRPAAGTAAGQENVLVGNTVLYGATGGSLFVAGRAGERFGVRNSGARAVVEGVGDHACEYMTQGVVVVLGETGRNFASGMSNGVAYVLDEFGEFARRVQDSTVGIERLTGGIDEELLLALVERHVHSTGSQRAQAVLSRWTHFRPRFWKVAPRVALAEETHEALVREHLAELRATSPEPAAASGVGG